VGGRCRLVEINVFLLQKMMRKGMLYTGYASTVCQVGGE